MMTRNVVNIPEIDAFVEQMTALPLYREVRGYLPTYRNWLIRNLSTADELRIYIDINTGEDAIFYEDHLTGEIDLYFGEKPDWLWSALERGEPVYRVCLGPEQFDDLVLVLMWFVTLENSPKFARLNRIDYTTALQKASAWRTHMLKNLTPDEEGVEVVRSFDDGFRVVRLLTFKALAEEGRRMGHCLGGYSDELYDGDKFFSLRDRRNQPHWSMWVWDSTDCDIWASTHSEIKGKQNAPPIERYRKYAAEFLAAEFGIRIDRFNLEAFWDGSACALSNGSTCALDEQNLTNEIRTEDEAAGRSVHDLPFEFARGEQEREDVREIVNLVTEWGARIQLAEFRQGVHRLWRFTCRAGASFGVNRILTEVCRKLVQRPSRHLWDPVPRPFERLRLKACCLWGSRSE